MGVANTVLFWLDPGHHRLFFFRQGNSQTLQRNWLIHSINLRMWSEENNKGGLLTNIQAEDTGESFPMFHEFMTKLRQVSCSNCFITFECIGFVWNSVVMLSLVSQLPPFYTGRFGFIGLTRGNLSFNLSLVQACMTAQLPLALTRV